MNYKIAVIGLGYVGLPVAIAFARKFSDVTGFDINKNRIAELLSGHDRTGVVDGKDLSVTTLKMTTNPDDLCHANFFVVAVPTPINKSNRPDLSLLIKASEVVGSVMQPRSIVVFESTVYPGVTEEICGPVLARVSGMIQGTDFKLGYSPERINPGDHVHTLGNVVKVVSAEDQRTLKTIAEVYATIIDAGIHRAPSIKVAEAAKVIENTQRDLNIALMNELAIIFDRLNIRTTDVLEAAGTKWNFMPFRPGLVGGHCIGVDPYYLTNKAEEAGYHPQVILAGRRINDGMGKYVAEQTVKYLGRAGRCICGAKVGIMGLAFKENVPDIRNSRVPDILAELREYGIEALVHDSICYPEEAVREYGIKLCNMVELTELDALVIAVAHDQYVKLGVPTLISKLKEGKGVIIDVKSIFKPQDFPEGVKYWSL